VVACAFVSLNSKTSVLAWVLRSGETSDFFGIRRKLATSYPIDCDELSTISCGLASGSAFGFVVLKSRGHTRMSDAEPPLSEDFQSNIKHDGWLKSSTPTSAAMRNKAIKF
jgi:hypothetical protein